MYNISPKAYIPAIVLFIVGIAGIFLNRPPKIAEIDVLCYNIRLMPGNDKGRNHWSKRKKFLADSIRDAKADIVCVQEAYREQIDFIHSHVAGLTEVGVGREDGVEAGEYSAILFRNHLFTLEDSGTFWLSSTPSKVGSTTWGNGVTRICTWAKLTHIESGKRIDFFNTHFDRQSEECRRRGMALIARTIAERPKPHGHVILAGDFDAAEDSWAYRYITGQTGDSDVLPDDPTTEDVDPVAASAPIVLRDTFRVLHPDESEVGTFHGFSGEARGGKIDHIFVESEGCSVKAAEIWRLNRDGWYPSDHFPVRATLRFR